MSSVVSCWTARRVEASPGMTRLLITDDSGAHRPGRHHGRTVVPPSRRRPSMVFFRSRVVLARPGAIAGQRPLVLPCRPTPPLRFERGVDPAKGRSVPWSGPHSSLLHRYLPAVRRVLPCAYGGRMPSICRSRSPCHPQASARDSTQLLGMSRLPDARQLSRTCLKVWVCCDIRATAGRMGSGFHPAMAIRHCPSKPISLKRWFVGWWAMTRFQRPWDTFAGNASGHSHAKLQLAISIAIFVMCWSHRGYQ